MTKLQIEQLRQQALPPQITNSQTENVEKLEEVNQNNYKALITAGISKLEASTIIYGHPHHTNGTFTNTKEEPWN